LGQGFGSLKKIQATSEPIDAVTALELYSNKDVVDIAYGNLKER